VTLVRGNERAANGVRQAEIYRSMWTSPSIQLNFTLNRNRGNSLLRLPRVTCPPEITSNHLNTFGRICYGTETSEKESPEPRENKQVQTKRIEGSPARFAVKQAGRGKLMGRVLEKVAIFGLSFS
tara:strand:+ start:1773 stop:2147 length:375 start_codon:yes stop_codon:yes gene_type:complete